jgi:transcriptional regulator with XRE-family HTH domain
MDKEKRKRLEAKGWKVGSAADFLGLSDEDNTYIELRMRLADALKSLRKTTVSQIEFAKAIGSSQSRVAKMEANDSSVSLDLMIKGLVSLGVTLPGLGKIITANQPVAAISARAMRSAKRPSSRTAKVVGVGLAKGKSDYIGGKFGETRTAKSATRTAYKAAKKK